jgi:putative CocE/NonD family hydrolase
LNRAGSGTIIETVVQETLEAKMRDGTVLRTDVWRPGGGGKHPLILIRLPYDKSQGEDICYAQAAWYAGRGYAVAVQDIRGRWASDGEFVPFEFEGDDGEDTMAWLDSLPFSNGRVGMYGFSYSGHTQLEIAVRKPPGLRCMVPAMTSADLYEGWAYNNGAFALAFNASWATFLAADVARRRDPNLEPVLAAQYANMNDYYWWLPLSAIPNLGPDGPGGFFSDWLGHETKDEYWKRWDLTDKLPEVQVPTLSVGGLYDIFLEGTIAAYHGIRSGAGSDDASLVIGPWYHMPWLPAFGDADFGSQGRNRVDQLQLAFFDQWLRDGEPAAGSRARVFVSGGNRWEDFEDWPPPSEPWGLHLRARTRANSINGDGYLSEETPDSSEEPDTYSYDPAAPILSRGGRSCCLDFVAPMGPLDQRPVESWNGVLVYTSEPLPVERTVLGTIRAHLFAATNQPDTDWVVKVCDVDPSGRSINIQENVQRARFAGGTDRSRPIAAGRSTEFVLELGTCAHLFKPGHRVRVQVSSSHFPHWDRNLNTGNPVGSERLSDRRVAIQTVLHDAAHPSRVVLPLLP